MSRILHILNHTQRMNGHVNQAIDLACKQSELGFNVAIASGGGNFDKILHRHAVKHIHINQNRRPLTILKATIKLTALARHFDIVHAHMATSAALSWIACKIAGIPLVTTVHNDFERSAIIMGLGKRVIAVSSASERLMIQRGIAKDRVRTVLNGTIGSPRHVEQLVKPECFDKLSILFVGGLHPRKGLPDLLRAFDIITQIFPQVHLHILGEGPRETEYKMAASTLACATSITFHGCKNDPRPWFSGADIFVLPSHAEPAGLVISEACEAGCAIVATDVGGVREMLDNGKAGTLVPPKDHKHLADVLLHLLTNTAAREHAKQCALDNKARMSLDRVVEETISVYRECNVVI